MLQYRGEGEGEMIHIAVASNVSSMEAFFFSPLLSLMRTHSFIYVSSPPVQGCFVETIRGPGQLSQYSKLLRTVRFGDRIPTGARFFAPVQTGPESHPNGYRVSFPRVKRPGRGFDRPPPSRAIPLLLFVTCSRVNFTFTVVETVCSLSTTLTDQHPRRNTVINVHKSSYKVSFLLDFNDTRRTNRHYKANSRFSQFYERA